LIITSIQLAADTPPKAQAMERVAGLLAQARGSDLVILPELWPCGYFSFDRYQSDSEPVDGPLVRMLRDQARAHGIHLFTGSFVERDGGNLYNTSLLLDPDGNIRARYRKVHLFGYQSREQQLLTAGDEAVVAETPWGPVGLSTCYDLRFPELYRRMLDRGAGMFLVTAAWPAARADAWQLFNRARAHENLAYLFSCNFARGAGEVPFAGHSLFVDPAGLVIADAGEEPGLLMREVDTDRIQAVRGEFPALADRVLKG
jgi:predicted amidohydrolase